ncbi:MAG: glucose-6-phosphate isomerase [Candidatus Cloacimonetes bacterium]|jgi:glucose-6-phosphate isomerase|nr:glucose-6-phosphate isomerase [Candidatus Cloacimonadota bacterium]MDD2505700.1 glucose-6-phosphate isomerase [Candidatus Cloacimonadota bacterium]MDD4147870.1 glucose-6-phosphate isomerase [Candidatus Cloacimonadota bacterium]MDD4559122.1 glucose-6-phosphate isomerase [Candidatus Cloacimonadota bacterium]
MIRFDHRNLLANQFLPGAMRPSRVLDFSDKVQEAKAELNVVRKAGILGFYDLPEQDTGHIKAFVQKLDPVFDTMVVLGIGGSALGNKAIYNALKTEAGLTRKVLVYDNADPVFLHEILQQTTLDKTLFNVITKSGGTAETMSAYMILLDILKRKYPQDFRKRMIITTDKEKGFLRRIADDEGYSTFTVPGNVGGRFSVLSDVGLLSSAFAGVDIDALLAGAAQMRNICEETEIMHNPALLNGLLHFLYMREGKNISVMMPYSNSLYDFADWYRQLWAESLGKRYDRKGREIFVGQTPVKALGTTDQHSQIQLYTEGPNDKVITFLSVEHFAHDYTIPNLHPDLEDISYLGGKKLSELLNAERLATEIALCKAGRPNANLIFPKIDAENIGSAIMMYEIQTVFCGKLLNINPLDQPGVETGKIATFALMGKNGYDKEREEIAKYTRS